MKRADEIINGISGDGELYTFFQILGMTDGQNGNALLVEHWRATGVLPRLNGFFSGRIPTPADGELQYVLVAEEFLQRLYEAVSLLFAQNKCSSAGLYPDDGKMRSDGAQLWSIVGQLRELNINRGWDAFSSELSYIASMSAKLTRELLSTGKPFAFATNATPERVISGKINYTTRTGEYFVFG